MNHTIAHRVVCLFVVVSLQVGCSSQITTRWAEDWSELPSAWRPKPIDIKNSTLALNSHVITSGISGFRFESVIAAIYGQMDSVNIEMHVGELLEVGWQADFKQLHGYVFRNEKHYQYWLVTNRKVLRMAGEEELNLVGRDGTIAFTLPKIELFFELDSGQLIINKIQANIVRCVGAEASLLARREILRINYDQESKIVHDGLAENLKKNMAFYLGSTFPLCD